MLNREFCYIDKTKALEKGINRFPSIYIEGAAASGKTVAVNMLLEKHPEVKSYKFYMDKEPEDLETRLDTITSEMNVEPVWVVFEHLDNNLTKECAARIRSFVRRMPENGRVIFVSRERPNHELLDLFWKREMDFISQEALCFTRSDVRSMLEQEECVLNAEEVYERTGGWPGYVEVLIRLSKMYEESVEELCKRYEVSDYIEQTVLSTISAEDKEILRLANISPWINEELCGNLLKLEETQEKLNALYRKGLLRHEKYGNKWYLSRILQGCRTLTLQNENMQKLWAELGSWYEAHGYVRATLHCLEKLEDAQNYQLCMKRHYHQIPFSGIDYSEVLSWVADSAEVIYLRSMRCYETQNLEGFWREIEKLKQLESDDPVAEARRQEIYLNLMFVNPNVALGEWMSMFENKQKIRIYHILGSGCTYLCGLRDLSGLFACTKKEENQNARFWKEHFGEDEWKSYCLARMDYYLETRREDSIKEEDWSLIDTIVKSGNEKWQHRLAALYLLCKWSTEEIDDNTKDKIYSLEHSFQRESNQICIRNAESVTNLYFSWKNDTEHLIKWIKRARDEHEAVNEDSYIEMFCTAKIHLLLNHYEKAEKILQKTLDYFQAYKKNKILAEGLFMMALINWEKDRRGQALKNCIESFMVNGNSRYIGIYTRYGKKGYEVLGAYVEWMKSTTMEGWHRKKKYNYGNVLRMPMEDYLDFVLRSAKHENKAYVGLMRHEAGERLTMTESIILQALSRGLSNTEICEEQNLKLPTVKTHIYSIYRKLGVNNRVQAILKGKEMGIVK